MKAMSCKLLVIGAGPGGYVCATRAGQRGIDTVIVEAERPGGTCLNVGCIPSKALIHAADEYDKVVRFAAGDSALGISAADPRIDLAKTMRWKDEIVGRLNGGVAGLLKNAAVKVVQGWAQFRDGKTVEVETETGLQVIHAEQVVIATGARPVELSALPFGGRVISSTEALALRQVPDRLVVVGGGYIGLELGTAFAKMGSQVTIVEALPRIMPQYDAARSDTAGRDAPAAARRRRADERESDRAYALGRWSDGRNLRRTTQGSGRRQDSCRGRTRSTDRGLGS